MAVCGENFHTLIDIFSYNSIHSSGIQSNFDSKLCICCHNIAIRVTWLTCVAICGENFQGNIYLSWQTDGRTDVQPIAKTCFSITADARKKLQPLRRCNWDLFFTLWHYVHSHLLALYRAISCNILYGTSRIHTSLFVCNNYYYLSCYTTPVAIGIEHINDYTLIPFVIRFERKFPIRRSLFSVLG